MYLKKWFRLYFAQPRLCGRHFSTLLLLLLLKVNKKKGRKRKRDEKKKKKKLVSYLPKTSTTHTLTHAGRKEKEKITLAWPPVLPVTPYGTVEFLKPRLVVVLFVSFCLKVLSKLIHRCCAISACCVLIG